MGSIFIPRMICGPVYPTKAMIRYHRIRWSGSKITARPSAGRFEETYPALTYFSISGNTSDSCPGMSSSESSSILFARSGDNPSCLGDLPSFETAKEVCEAAFGETNTLYCFIDTPAFYLMLAELYKLPGDYFMGKNNDFLNLLFSILALGFHVQDKRDNERNRSGDLISKTGIDQGRKYFTCARCAIDISDCGTIPQLQTVLFLVLYLQSTAGLDVGYSYIILAQQSAFRMGLHLKHDNQCNPIESEVRLRIFWTIQKMDISMSAILGYPKILDLDTIDQEMPTEVFDVNITESSENGYPVAKWSSLLQASNAHMRLILILDKVIKYIYPNNRVGRSVNEALDTGHIVDHAIVREIENDLQRWRQGLPMGILSGRSENHQSYCTQQLLSLVYAHVQMMLYRPFLSYISGNAFVDANKNKKSQACASAYFGVCQNVIRIVKELQERGLAIGPRWFTINITSFATLSLVYFNCQRTNLSRPSDLHPDPQVGHEATKVIAQRKRDACSFSSAFQTLSRQISPKTMSSIRGTVASTHSKEVLPISATLSVEREQIQTRSDSRSCLPEEAPNCEPTNQRLEWDNENVAEVSNLASNTRQDSVLTPCERSDDEIFEFINFEGDEGLKGFDTQNESVAGTCSLDMESIQDIPTESTDLAFESMSMDNFIHSWKYDNGVPDLDEMIETGICLAESRNGASFGPRNQKDNINGTKVSN
ncbi:BgTH12-03426 [Blumeria graminis f. sp. triticale]|uniref:BgTH12-03426 n=1 Tax=Blumeria graminis f. sp. triticale TaxID=1689686 RepID=A0A9W4CVM2_BLUGR|nr:BgTH12-03426 [Blumeria graminis f. sp. triticale]